MEWTAELLSARGRLGAYTQQARHDTRETTAKARAAMTAKFARQVDPDGVLPDDERARRAEAARKAFYADIALKGARARWRKARECRACKGTGTRPETRAETRAGDAA